MIRYKTLYFFLIVFLANCSNKKTLFQSLAPSETGVTFENRLTESETQNILAYEYFYNGGGVAAADFNNDGRTDLFFTGNQVANKLYLNTTGGQEKGITFEDISKQAKIEGRADGWKTGVAVADVNADGWLDIYVCYSGNGSKESRKNQLFINNGSPLTPPLVREEAEGKGVTFTEQAETYGIADTGYSTQATFFDYDRDGDLDLFVMNHNLKGYQRKEAAFMKAEVDENAGDRLYRNEALSPQSSHLGENRRQGGFTNVTLSAHIKSNALGFGLGVVVADFNQDNWPDLYVANDYVEEDYLYLNNQKGGFEEVGKEAMGHFSYSSMGVDAADINNDALPDLFTCDMLPDDSRRQKLLAFPDNWNVQQSMLDNGFHWQNMRNMLQINTLKSQVISTKSLADDNNSLITHNSQLTTIFSEIGQLAGVSNTDWSWSPLFADFDNDGHKDLFVSNGFVKDLTDLDFVKFQDEAKGLPLLEQLKKMPTTPTHHYAFKNNGNLTFKNMVSEWGFEQSTVACGAIYADLDNDGDLDLITNNTNEPAHIYKNTQQETDPQTYLKVEINGPYSLGAKAWLYADTSLQYIENQPTHGFQSAVIAPLHFGLGKAKKIDSVRVQWADGKSRLFINPKPNQMLKFSYESDFQTFNIIQKNEPYFQSVAGIDFLHKENLNIDFNRQILIPKLYSRNGPKMTVGDVNGDGLEDVFVCGAQNQAGALFLQNSDGKFIISKQIVIEKDAAAEDCDALFFDADNDNDLDLYVVSGGYEQRLDDAILQDRLYLNNGKGQFEKGTLPTMFTNKSCVKPIDFDLDGDIDLFVGGSVKCGLFPYNSISYLLKNDGKAHFSIVQTFDLGLVTDAAIADIDHDKYSDIIVTAEWQPIQVLGNKRTKEQRNKGNEATKFFELKTQSLNHSITHLGWWSRIAAADLDNDGDMDFVVGNVGQNNQFGASPEKPVMMYYGDFDQSGSIDAYMTHFFGEKAFPIYGRDEALEQMASLRKKFIDYKSYSTATIEDVFSKETIEKATKFTFNEPRTGLLINENGELKFDPLPIEAQFAPVYAIEIADFNNDNKLDILLGGNNSTYRIRVGKMDANHGILLLGNGRNKFKATSSGLSWQGDVRDIQTINTKNGKHLIVSQNNNKVLLYKALRF